MNLVICWDVTLLSVKDMADVVRKRISSSIAAVLGEIFSSSDKATKFLLDGRIGESRATG